MFNYFGELTDEDLIQSHEEVYSSSELGSMKGKLINYEGVEKVGFLVEAIKNVAYRDRQIAIDHPNVKVAIVTDNALLVGLTRLYERCQVLGGWETEVFEDEIAARKWLAQTNQPA